jgi:hypothetical protein
MVRQLKRLGGYGEDVAIAMIEQSIEQGYQGIFEVRARSAPAKSTQATHGRPASVYEAVALKGGD